MTSEDRFQTIEYRCPHCEETVNVEKPEDLRYCKCNRFEWLRTDYFHGKKFVPKKLADELLTEYHIITPANMPLPYYYDEKAGHYKRAKHHLEQQISIRLKHDDSTNRAKETIAHIKNITYTHNHDEPQPTLINLANGTYDLEDDTLLEHTPANFFLNGIPVNYDENADCPRTKQFLREITATEDDALALEEFMGYCLYRAMPKHRAFLLVGEGANGKSTYLNLLQKLIGKENYSSVSLQDLINRPFLRARLYGKLANIFADLPNTALTSGGTGIFKALTGADSMDAEIKFVQDPVNFENHAKLIFSCNQIPKSEDDSFAFWRRWTIIRFPKIFKDDQRDTELPGKLEAELPGVLNLALNGLKRLRNNKWEFSNERDESETRTEYLKNSDSFKYFVETHVEVTYDPEDYVPKDEFYSAYCAYVLKEKLGFPEAKNTVSKRLYELLPGIQQERKRLVDGRVNVWVGIKVKEENEKVGGLAEKTDDYEKFDCSTIATVEEGVSAYHYGIESWPKWTDGHTISDTSFNWKKNKNNIKNRGKNPDMRSKLSNDLQVVFRRNDNLIKRSELEDFMELAGHEPKQTKALIDSLISNGSLTAPKADFLKATEEYLR